MYEFLATASELLFKDANVLLKLREWFFSQAGNILLALIIFFVGRYIIRWIKNVAVRVMTLLQWALYLKLLIMYCL